MAAPLYLVLAFLMAALSPASASTPEVHLAFMPMDDRPATEIFPQQVAAICGATVELPPQAMLGHFTRPGNADALGRWLLDLDTRELNAVVVSSDMLSYGGLVASRNASTSLAEALAHVQTLARFHELHPNVPLYVFATIMRLAPTQPPTNEPYIDALTTYAQFAGAEHPTPDEETTVQAARKTIPGQVFADYVGARARDVAVDKRLLTLAAQNDIAWLAITQDDAGAPDGLQVGERHGLEALAHQLGIENRVVFKAGADEMGMVSVTRTIEDALRWHARADVVYSDERTPRLRDPLEDVSIADSIASSERALGLSAGDVDADFSLYTLLPGTPAEARQRFLARAIDRLRADQPTALADLTFVDQDVNEERVLFEALENADVADKPLAYASWNSTANTAGTALASATCAALAQHFGRDTVAARQNFLFDRYVDDYAYRLLVRPELNADLRLAGANPFALAGAADPGEAQARRRLWPLAVDIFDDDFKPRGWRLPELGIYLPWQRTFEVRLETALTM